MKIIARIVLAAILLLYPVFVYIGLVRGSIRTLALGLLAVVIIRFMVLSGNRAAGLQAWSIWLMTAVMIVLVVTVFISNEGHYFLYYPVIMNALFLGVFATSLLRPPSMIERFARIREPDLPAEGVIYTRRVTWIWCGFFLLNGLTALYTVTEPLEVWTLYNGLVSYLLMGTLFLGEFVVRQFVIKKQVG